MRRERLIDARQAIGKSQEDIAELVGVDRTTIGKWERGESTPMPNQRSAYAEALGVTLSELHAMLSSLPVSDDEIPNWLTFALSVEQAATAISAHELCVVYGLLQTPDYAAAIARSVGVTQVSDDYVKRTIDMRRHRQQRVHNGDVELHVVQPEAALRSRMGDDQTMADQMRRLVELSTLDNVTIQVVPLDVGQYEAQRLGIFSLQSLPWSQIPKVNLEAYGGVRFIDGADEVRFFQAAFEHAAHLALTPKASVDFITELATEWENRP